MARTERKTRVALNGQRNILTVDGKDPNYSYRIVNDTGDRIAQFEAQGYEIVSDKTMKVGDRRVANPTAEGSPVQVSVGGGTKAFVMRIKKEFALEDAEAKQVVVNETEAAMKKDAVKNADYGNLQIS